MVSTIIVVIGSILIQGLTGGKLARRVQAKQIGEHPRRRRIVDMQLPVVSLPESIDASAAEALTAAVHGEVRWGRHDRMLYATDASMYQVEPLGVVIPADVGDVISTVCWCAQYNVPLLARGGGSSLSGQTVNTAIILDCSTHLTAVGDVDDDHCRVRVEPGVVLDDLQRHVGARGLMFGPEVSSSAQATLGGMIANCSAGLHSLKWGMTERHIHALDAVLADGCQVRLDRGGATRCQRVASLTKQVADIVLEVADDIDAIFPTLPRNVGGYALDRVLSQIRSSTSGTFDEVNLSTLVSGSEGSLAVVIGADLDLVPTPTASAMAVISFGSLKRALEAVPAILSTAPSAVELLDATIIVAARGHEQYSELVDLLPRVDGKDPVAVLYVDWLEEDEQCVRAAVEMIQSLSELGDANVSIVNITADRNKLWALRKTGLGLILSGNADGVPVGGVEDCAVPVEKLLDFHLAFESLLRRHDLYATWYAHASVGLLHIRPRLNLSDASDRNTLTALTTETTALVREFGGTVSGEHGDGRVRARMMHDFYGERLVEAFRRIKHVFDPAGLLNPGIITTDPGMLESLRPSPTDADKSQRSFFRWPKAGSLLNAASTCNGNGLCRRSEGGGMCPSFRATRDERHATRGRGNALRLAIGGLWGGGDTKWTDADTLETLDLCLGCKACRYECPATVDVTHLKAEYQAQTWRVRGGAPMRVRMKAAVRRFNCVGSLLHPMSTVLIRSGPIAWMLRGLMGIAPSRRLPSFSRSLTGWMRRRAVVNAGAPTVLLYADCFTTWSESSIGQDAVRLLEAFGYQVVMSGAGCCGRTCCSAGLLDEACTQIEASAVRLLKEINTNSAVAVLAVEPTCATALQQEWVELQTSVEHADMNRIAALADTVEGFISNQWATHPFHPAFDQVMDVMQLHQHCHQKHRGDVTLDFLHRCGWPGATLLDNGCCGMAGAFGYERRHDEISRKVAEQSLGAACRCKDAVTASGTSCRHQIGDCFGREAQHPVTLAARALAGG